MLWVFIEALVHMAVDRHGEVYTHTHTLPFTDVAWRVEDTQGPMEYVKENKAHVYLQCHADIVMHTCHRI